MEMRLVRRLVNAGRKVAAGLSLFGENISPEVPNDLYQAHLSIYHFFAGFCHGTRVFDVGCGAGYGSALLAQTAAAVVGMDLDERNIRYARRHYRAANLQFLNGDACAPPSPIGLFDVVVSSNVFEHLLDVERALDGVLQRFQTTGRFILAVPPIVDAASLRANEAIPYHRSNLFVTEWHRILATRFRAIELFVHASPDGVALDFSNPYPSAVRPDQFRFYPASIETYAEQPTLTALFLCTHTPSFPP